MEDRSKLSQEGMRVIVIGNEIQAKRLIDMIAEMKQEVIPYTPQPDCDEIEVKPPIRIATLTSEDQTAPPAPDLFTDPGFKYRSVNIEKVPFPMMFVKVTAGSDCMEPEVLGDECSE